MSNQLTTFDFNALPVRVVEREGEPWFLAADVLRALSMDSRQSQNYLRNIGPDEKKVVCITQGKGNPNKTYVGRTDLGLSPGKPMVIISEIGDFAVSVKMGRNGGTFACKALGLDNPSYVTKRLSEDEKASFKLPNQRGSAAKLISESGLYKLVDELSAEMHFAPVQSFRGGMKLDSSEKATINRITLGLAPGKSMVIISKNLAKLIQNETGETK